MAAKVVPVLALGAMLVSCAGVYGPKGNDTGGIIPWSPENEQMAHQIAQGNCDFYRKYAVLRTMHRAYGDYISYDCVFPRPHGQRTRRKQAAVALARKILIWCWAILRDGSVWDETRERRLAVT